MPDAIPEITVTQLKAALAGPNPPRLIDVREQDEWDAGHIAGAELLPLSQWPQVALDQLQNKARSLAIHCHHGGRSARATAWLLAQGFADVRNVKGGIDAWSLEVDASVPRY